MNSIAVYQISRLNHSAGEGQERIPDFSEKTFCIFPNEHRPRLHSRIVVERGGMMQL